MPTRLQTLDEIEAGVWQELSRAGAERGHPWRSCVLATAAPQSDDPTGADARLVVLRSADAQTRQLEIYTDSRARKVTQLRAHPVATIVMWSPDTGWQLRCRVRCEVEVAGLAVSSRWAKVKLSPQAQDYLSPLAPGEPLDGRAPAGSQRESFALIVATITRIDWMELNRDGHRRAVFEGGTGRWVQP